jgi:hypothetical protein
LQESYQTGSHNTTHLSNAHRRSLEVESAISPEIIAQRGVRTVSRGRELPNAFSRRQKARAPGILFTAQRPNGETSVIFRPDEPDPDNPGHKYEQPCKAYGGAGNVLDVHPAIRHLIDGFAPVLFLEGIKKADAVTTAALAANLDILAVAISGVWNFLTKGEPIPDFYDIPLEGRRAYIGFDSDMLRKPEVQEAAERLAEELRARGAEVWVIYLPDQADGSKMGADDYLAAGHSLEELLSLAKPFDPESVQREKLSRSEKLRRSLAYLEEVHDELPARRQGECSERAAYRAYLQTAHRHSRLVADGIEVRLSSRTGAELAAMGRNTFSRATHRLEEAGILRRIKFERSEHADSYVLLVPSEATRAQVGHKGTEPGQSDTERGTGPGVYRGVPLLRGVPELRYSRPARKARRGVVQGTRKVRQGRDLAADIPGLKRLGKRSGEIVRYLEGHGGSATEAELMSLFAGPKTRRRDFRRRSLAPLRGLRYDLELRMWLTTGPPIVEVEGGVVRLVEDWLEALGHHRRTGEEPQAAANQRLDHLRERTSYRAYRAGKADKQESNPTLEGLEAIQRSHEHREEYMVVQGGEEAVRAREDARERIDDLVLKGMKRSIATAEVIGGDGFTSELESEPDPEPPPKRPSQVGGVYHHGPLCECDWCQ